MNILTLPKLLCIEHDSALRARLRGLLESHYLVLEAGSALDGIELAKNTLPDIVLLEMNLPQMTGPEVATLLKSIVPDAPLVALSADILPEARARALAAGFAGLITRPIDEKTLLDEVNDYLHGKREELSDVERHLRAYQSELVEHLEAKVRDLTRAFIQNQNLREQNQLIIDALIRRQKMLEAGARVSHDITSILNLNDLLNAAVDTICNEFGLYYSGIFLLSEDKTALQLQAGHGEAGRVMLERRFSLPVDEHSMIGQAVLRKEAQIALDVDGQPSRFQNPLLPETRSEMALPLIFKEEVLGALSVQSADLNAFSEEDVTALQSLADQIAIAIHNAQLLRRLEAANQELLRSKTFEAIATATGEALHWVGNKAAPVPGAAERLREDLARLLAVFYAMENDPDSPLRMLGLSLLEEAHATGIDLPALAAGLKSLPEARRNIILNLASMFEDLQIIEDSAKTILTIKEDLIGPARRRNPVAFSLSDELARLVKNMGLPESVIITEWEASLPLVFGDPRQIDQVFNNLIKNAWEALEGHPAPEIRVRLSLGPEPGFLLACVQDNGPGIPPEALEKIWVSFFTTKGHKGGTGLGLPACMEIVRQNGGKIWVESQPGQGASFYVTLPLAKPTTEE
mgnify:CR=1 FL=1